MFSHVFIGINDFERAFAFYEPLLATLGQSLRFSDATKPWAGWQPPQGGRPLFVIGKPFDGAEHVPGNGQMTAFLAADWAMVDEAYRLALKNGGVGEGAPGLRPQYHANYYGAYFRDPEGNKLCVACHQAQA